MKIRLVLIAVAIIGSVLYIFDLERSKAQAVDDNHTAPVAQEGLFSRDEAFERLILLAREKGTARVIISLKVDFTPIGDLSPAARQRQEADIRRVQSDLLEKLAGYNVKEVKQFQYIPALGAEVDAEALAKMRHDPQIVSIQEDERRSASLAESVPLVGAPAAWTAGFTGSGWAVAVLDTGVDKTHSFLTGKVISEACYSSNIPAQNVSSLCPGGVTSSTATGSGVNCSPSVAGCDHGTHVAGIAAGTNASFSGVAKGGNLIAVQVFSRVDNVAACSPNPSPCTTAYVSDIILGLERVQTLSSSTNIAAVNMSLGGGFNGTYCDAVEASTKAAIDNLRSVRIATVIASGNNGFTNGISAPACISTAISVGSTGDGSVCPNGSPGCQAGTATLNAVSNFSNSASILNLLAPGAHITSSIPGGGFEIFDGTSMAAPHVAGAWAILRQRSPSASVTTNLNALSLTGLSIHDPGNGLFKPRISVNDALGALGATCTPSTPPWQIEPSMNSAHYSGAAAVVGGNLYALGGGLATTANESFNGATWTVRAPMPMPGAQLRAATIGNNIYVPGGYNGGPLNAMRIYNTVNDSWTSGAALPAARAGAAVVSFNNRVYVIGGSSTNTVFIYDPAANSYTTGAPMPGTSDVAPGVLFNGEIYVVGGPFGAISRYAYNPTTNTWRTIAAPLSASCQSGGAFVFEGEIWMVGCWPSSDQAHIYNPSTDSWRRGPIYNFDHQGPGVAVFMNRPFVLGGGPTSSGSRIVESLIAGTSCGNPTPSPSPTPATPTPTPSVSPTPPPVTPTPTPTPATPTPTPTPPAGCAGQTFVPSGGLPTAIPDNVPAGVNITIPVSGLTGTLTSVQVRNWTWSPLHTWGGDITMTLQAPVGGPTATITQRRGQTTCGTGFGNSDDLVGPYNFGDAFATNFHTTPAQSGVPVPAGNYFASRCVTTPGETVSLNTIFGGPVRPDANFPGLEIFDGLSPEAANGNWTLNISDNGGGDTGTVSAVNLCLVASGGGGTPTPTPPTPTPTPTPSVSPTPPPVTPTPTPTPTTPTPTPTPPAGCAGQVFVPSGGLPTAIPDNVPAGVNITIPVSGLTGTLTVAQVRNWTWSPLHTWGGDIKMTLQAPSGGPTATITQRRGQTTCGTGFGNSDDLVGPYNFGDAFATNFHTTPPLSGVPVPAGDYRATECAGTPGALVNLNSIFTGPVRPADAEPGLDVFDGLSPEAANGNWTLNISDNAGGDTGTMSAVALCLVAGGGGGATPTPTPSPSPGSTPLYTRGDYDGDNKTDLTVWRPTAFAPNLSAFYTFRSSNGGFFGIQFGNTGDVAIAGDFDGDNMTDFGVSRYNTSAGGVDLIYLESSTNTAKFPVWGNAGDIFISGDYDGDKKTDVMAWRPSNGTWYIVNSSGANGGFTFITHGQNGDKPYAMDTDGDGSANLVYFRPSSGDWVVRNSNGSSTTTNFGLGTDIPVPADYDGDNKDDIAVFRDGLWIVRKSSNGQVEFQPFGAAGDIPVPGDYDGDNLYDRAVYRQGIWHMLRSSQGYTGFQFGAPTDTAMPKAYIP